VTAAAAAAAAAGAGAGAARSLARCARTAGRRVSRSRWLSQAARPAQAQGALQAAAKPEHFLACTWHGPAQSRRRLAGTKVLTPRGNDYAAYAMTCWIRAWHERAWRQNTGAAALQVCIHTQRGTAKGAPLTARARRQRRPAQARAPRRRPPRAPQRRRPRPHWPALRGARRAPAWAGRRRTRTPRARP